MKFNTISLKQWRKALDDLFLSEAITVEQYATGRELYYKMLAVINGVDYWKD